jgi:hypothetical protein
VPLASSHLWRAVRRFPATASASSSTRPGGNAPTPWPAPSYRWRQPRASYMRWSLQASEVRSSGCRKHTLEVLPPLLSI